MLDNLEKMNNLPLVTDIKRHSLEDGPGIRSVVFFKGCPLRCVFCHNPETKSTRMEIAFSERECIQCEECADACPQGAIDIRLPGRINRDRCNHCGKCAGVCPGKGLRLIGSYYSVEALTEVLLRDLPFYLHSGGGVTISGGEPTLYPDYLELLFKRLKARGVHLILQTSGFFDYQSFRQKILPYLDLIYYDIKIADPELHREYIGKTNHRILDNLCHVLREKGVEIHPRVPLIPNITATEANLSSIVDLLCEAKAGDVSLLPYNPMGIEMAGNLGLPRPPLPDSFMSHDEERRVYDTFKSLIKERRKPQTP